MTGVWLGCAWWVDEIMSYVKKMRLLAEGILKAFYDTMIYILISASTPAGRERFWRESMVLGVALEMSTRRLWTFISKASPPVL